HTWQDLVPLQHGHLHRNALRMRPVISVLTGDILPVRLPDAGVPGAVGSPIYGQSKQPDPRILRSELLQRPNFIFIRVVVDEEHLNVLPRLPENGAHRGTDL